MSIDYQMHFDPAPILAAGERAEKKILMGFGGYVRRVARNSIKPASGTEISLPDQPPLGHTQTNQTYRNFIFFVYDPGTHSVVIGGELLSRSAGEIEPEKIEYGGDETVLVYDPDTKQYVQIRATYFQRPAMRMAFQKTIDAALPRLIENSLH